MNNSISIIGVPLDLGAENLGVDGGPSAFRANGIEQKLSSVGFDVADVGDVACGHRNTTDKGDNSARYEAEIARIAYETSLVVKNVLTQGRIPVVLGGDHSIDLGAFSGASDLYQQQLGMIYLDAHGDINTPETSLSGNVHGMHLASLMGWGPDSLTKVGSGIVKLSKNNLLHIGGSDMDDAELKLIAQENLNCFSLLDIMAYGLGPLLAKIDELASQVPYIWVSLDLDVIDRMYAPGAAMPNSGGVTYREISALCQYIGQMCNVVGLDVVELNPLQDIEYKTNELAIEMIAKLLGKNYSWYTNYMLQNHQ